MQSVNGKFIAVAAAIIIIWICFMLTDIFVENKNFKETQNIQKPVACDYEIDHEVEAHLIVMAAVRRHDAVARFSSQQIVDIANCLYWIGYRFYRLDMYTVMATACHESQMNPLAVGLSGDYGLCQVLESTGNLVSQQAVNELSGYQKALPYIPLLKWRGRETLLDPVANIIIAMTYMVECYRGLHGKNPVGNLELIAYNGGLANAIRRDGKTDYDRFNTYVKAVKAQVKILKQDVLFSRGNRNGSSDNGF